MRHSDFLIIGGGIIGVNIARALRQEFPKETITILEKEAHFGAHSSGRNSGVLHAGFYYTANSLKAQFTKEGNRYLRSYCEQKKLPINHCGKLVVAQSEEDLSQIDELLKRARLNQVELHEITLEEARKIEPRVRSYERILWSPTTSTVNPTQVLHSLIEDARNEKIEILTDRKYLSSDPEKGIVRTNQEEFSAGYVINAAGLYADKIALDFGFSKDFRIVPFKGLYLYAEDHFGPLRTHIYPVPNLKNPFLGVHFTLTVDGHVKLGPTAIPAFWKEQYSGFDNFDVKELFEVVGREINLLVTSEFDFKKLAVEELQKYSKNHLVSLSKKMINQIPDGSFVKWGKAGIRAQLLNIRTKKLEMDFIFEGDKKSFHVLNAVSPAFTSSIPFSNYLVQQIKKNLSA